MATTGQPVATPQWHIAQRNLKISPYLATICGIGAVVLFFWFPFYPLSICFAAALGAITFGIQWLGIRRGTHLGFLGLVLTIFLLLPISRKMPVLSAVQVLCAWMFSFAVLHVICRKWLTRDLERHAPKPKSL
jgi:hypothetical protein